MAGCYGELDALTPKREILRPQLAAVRRARRADEALELRDRSLSSSSASRRARPSASARARSTSSPRTPSRSPPAPRRRPRRARRCASCRGRRPTLRASVVASARRPLSTALCRDPADAGEQELLQRRGAARRRSRPRLSLDVRTSLNRGRGHVGGSSGAAGAARASPTTRRASGRRRRGAATARRGAARGLATASAAGVVVVTRAGRRRPTARPRATSRRRGAARTPARAP